MALAVIGVVVGLVGVLRVLVALAQFFEQPAKDEVSTFLAARYQALGHGFMVGLGAVMMACRRVAAIVWHVVTAVQGIWTACRAVVSTAFGRCPQLRRERDPESGQGHPGGGRSGGGGGDGDRGGLSAQDLSNEAPVTSLI